MDKISCYAMLFNKQASIIPIAGGAVAAGTLGSDDKLLGLLGSTAGTVGGLGTGQALQGYRGGSKLLQALARSANKVPYFPAVSTVLGGIGGGMALGGIDNALARLLGAAARAEASHAAVSGVNNAAQKVNDKVKGKDWKKILKSLGL